MGEKCCGNNEDHMDHMEDLAFKTANLHEKKEMTSMHYTEYVRFLETFKEAVEQGKPEKEALKLAFDSLN